MKMNLSRAAVFAACSVFLIGLGTIGRCAQSEGATWSFWLPWPASRIEQVYPEDVTPWPIPGYLPNYGVSYFRGYELLHRQPRTLEEGAWTRNYDGHERNRRPRHRWWRGQGSYISDGPLAVAVLVILSRDSQGLPPAYSRSRASPLAFGHCDGN